MDEVNPRAGSAQISQRANRAGIGWCWRRLEVDQERGWKSFFMLPRICFSKVGSGPSVLHPDDGDLVGDSHVTTLQFGPPERGCWCRVGEFSSRQADTNVTSQC